MALFSILFRSLTLICLLIFLIFSFGVLVAQDAHITTCEPGWVGAVPASEDLPAL